MDMVYTSSATTTLQQLSEIATETLKDHVLSEGMWKWRREGCKKGSGNQHYHIQSQLSVVVAWLTHVDR